MSDDTIMDGMYHLLALSYRNPFHMSGSPYSQARSYISFPPYIGNGKMCIASISSISGYIKEKGYLNGNLYQYYIPYIGLISNFTDTRIFRTIIFI